MYVALSGAKKLVLRNFFLDFPIIFLLIFIIPRFPSPVSLAVCNEKNLVRIQKKIFSDFLGPNLVHFN